MYRFNAVTGEGGRYCPFTHKAKRPGPPSEHLHNPLFPESNVTVGFKGCQPALQLVDWWTRDLSIDICILGFRSRCWERYYIFFVFVALDGCLSKTVKKIKGFFTLIDTITITLSHGTGSFLTLGGWGLFLCPVFSLSVRIPLFPNLSLSSLLVQEDRNLSLCMRLAENEKQMCMETNKTHMVHMHLSCIFSSSTSFSLI